MSMDLWATKDRYERETEETERLVRPAPKVKPPRKDLRRERTEADRDPDIDDDPDITRDKDLSLNYKNIGGSVVARVVARFLFGHDLTSLRVVARHIQADLDRGDYVAVVNKQTGETTHVKKETLKGPEGSKYKVVKEEEAEGEAKGEPKKKGPSDEDSAAVRELAKAEPRLKGVMDTLADPKHKEHTTLTSLPDLPLGSILKGVKFPEGVKTLGDLQSIVESAPKPGRKEKAPPKKAPAAPPAEEKKPEAPPKEAPTAPPAEEKKPETPPKEEPAKTEPPKEPEKKEEPEKPAEVKKEAPAEAPIGPPPGALPEKPSEEEIESDEEFTRRFVKDKGYEKPDFKAWVKKQQTISEDDDGTPLYRVPGLRARVPFEQLPIEEQYKVFERFDEDYVTEKSVDKLKQLAAKNPQFKKVLRELANPNSGLRAKIDQLETEAKSQGLDLSSYDVKKSIAGLEDVNLPPHLQEDLEHFIKAADKAYGPPPEPERPKVNKQESDRADAAITETLPPEFADHVASMGLHPDQVSHLLSGYKAAMRAKVSDDHVLSAAGFQLDPEHIEPPEFVHTGGKKIAFEDLSPEEQSNAFDQYKMHVLATSMAARQRMENQFADTGLPAGPAKIIAETALKFKGKDLDDGTVQNFFSTSLATSFADKPLGPDDIRDLFKRVKDNPAAKKLVAAYVQANTYLQAREKFLDTDAPKDSRITEWDDPEKIAKRVQKASEFIRDMTSALPHDALVVDPGMAFRNRVLDRMGTLAGEKVPYIRSYLKDFEMKDYETRNAQAEKLQKTFDEALKKERQTREKERAEVQKDPYREAPEPEEGSEEDTKDLLDRLAKKGLVKPKVPVQPPEYQDWKHQKEVEESAKASYSWLQNLVRGRAEKKQRKREETEDIAKKREERLLGEVEDEEGGPPLFEPKLSKTASLTVEERVLLRTLIPSLRQRVAFLAEMGLRSSYSSYPGCWTMGDSSPGVRTAVYWGQEPYEQTEAYPGWQQLHARDFGDADFNSILKAAREWLKLPVLSREIRGLYPDTQFRAALDLALRDHENGKYSVGLYPTVYNELLARLSGQGGPYELLTGKPDDVPVAGVKNAGKSTYGATTERGTTTMKASAQVRLFASRAASGTPDPELAFDLAALADRLAAEEAQGGSAAQAGQQQAPAQEAEAQKQAAIRVAATQMTKFNSVKALVVKQATAYPTLREVFLPILQALKG